MLNTQISEYDCAPTTLLNSLRLILQRDEIPVDIIRIIYHNTLDAKNKIIGDCGTSRNAMKQICKKMNRKFKKYGLNIQYKYYNKNKFTIDNIDNCLNKNGLVIVRSKLDVEHYYLIVKKEFDNYLIWDPYLEINIQKNYNKTLSKQTLNNEKDQNYSLGKIKNREIIIITKYC